VLARMQGVRLGVLAKVLSKNVLQGCSHDVPPPYCLDPVNMMDIGIGCWYPCWGLPGASPRYGTQVI
jgi:hypothetical protein